jgi:hypothetical protein
MLPCQVKPALIRAPAPVIGSTIAPSDGKNVAQYEAVFLQLADEHRTVNAFELHELLDACLPNGTIADADICTISFFVNSFYLFCRLHQELR